jgi:hypothetical protein
MTKALAKGAAIRWQGYVARLGFGMTLSRNQTRANKPVTGSNKVGQLRCETWNCLPVLGQILTITLFIVSPFR